MVLESRPTDQGKRFLIGFCIIAASIYGFYLSLAKGNSPELFLTPEAVAPGTYPCREVRFGRFTLCIPLELDVASNSNGSLSASSARFQIRGEIRFIEKLPQEEGWRKSLRNPIIRAWLGDELSLGAVPLMTKILGYRYNPTLMGIKAKIIPSWMKKNPGAEILIPKENEALLFYTPHRFLGITAQKQGFIVLSFLGTMDKAKAAGMIRSVRLVPSA